MIGVAAQRAGMHPQTLRVYERRGLINPRRTARDSVRQPLAIWGRGDLAEQWATVDRLLDEVGIDPARAAESRPHQFSGGQCQRVAIARALVTEPDLILADEPTGNLDSQSAEDILRMLRHACDERGRAIVMVTHDPKAAGFADRGITLRDGKVVSEVEMGGKGHARTNLARVAESL